MNGFEEMIEKMIEWFEHEINDHLDWCDVYVTDEQVKQIARNRTANLIGYINNQNEYIPGELIDNDEEG